MNSNEDKVYESLRGVIENFKKKADQLTKAYAAMQKDFKNLNVELDRKNNELAESLRKHEETKTYLESILESMNNGVIGVDTWGNVTRFNSAASEITGYNPSEVLGNFIGEIIQSREEEEGNDILSVLRTKKGHARDEKVIWKKSGNPVTVSFQSALLKDNAGTIIGAVEIFSDISRMKALEEEMRQNRTMAAIGKMAATVAHEIRNPLGAMGMWAGMLERDIKEGDPGKKTIGKMTNALSRLNRIVSNLLVYSRPVSPNLRPVALKELLEETLSYIEIEIDRMNKDVEVIREYNGADNTLVNADPEKMGQALMNLCLNALHAVDDESGFIKVYFSNYSEERESLVKFSIEDNGVGIEKEELDKIFDPFFTTKENGTGLGLAIVKKFIEYQSGYIKAESSKGEGTVFHIFLPAIKKEE